MKIILSRKGFDSSSGGVASPILPDGRLIPLPIPAKNDPHSFGQITINGILLGPLVEQLTAGKIERTSGCHLDPDLEASSAPRPAGWQPAFGQIKSAQKHLETNGVGIGDLFLFFGWFRAVEETSGRWRYVRGSPNLHVIYGWMQVGEVVNLSNRTHLRNRLAPLSDHPHLHGRDHPSNTLYLASDRVSLPDLDCSGAGMFRKKSDGRILTNPGQPNRSVWRLPTWFHPQHKTVFSYHQDSSRWALADEHCFLISAARGQEFVVSADTTGRWLHGIFQAQE